MKIGVIGAGRIGSALAKRLIPAGHEVMLSFARDAKALEKTAHSYRAGFGSVEQAATFGEVVVLCTPWQAVPEALGQAGSLGAKVLWDCTNALKPDLSGLVLGATTSAAETVRELSPGARVVKGIPPFAELLHSDDPTVGGSPVDAFICSDDAEAKALVWPLLESLPTRVIDAGPLDSARFVEPAAFLLVRLAYELKLGPRLGLRLRQD